MVRARVLMSRLPAMIPVPSELRQKSALAMPPLPVLWPGASPAMRNGRVVRADWAMPKMRAEPSRSFSAKTRNRVWRSSAGSIAMGPFSLQARQDGHGAGGDRRLDRRSLRDAGRGRRAARVSFRASMPCASTTSFRHTCSALFAITRQRDRAAASAAGGPRWRTPAARSAADEDAAARSTRPLGDLAKTKGRQAPPRS